MTLYALRDHLEHLERMGVRLLPPCGGELDLYVPDEVELSDEIMGALSQHKGVLMAWVARWAICGWPAAWRSRWGLAANKLEEEHGLRFPESEVEAFNQIRAE